MNKKKWAGGLGVAASVATILTLFLTLGQPSSTPTPNPTITTTAYPQNIQSNFLNSCEVNGSVSSCQCSLSFFETTVSLSQFLQDDQQASQGVVTQDFVNAANACR